VSSCADVFEVRSVEYYPHRMNLRTFTGPPTAAGDVSLRAAGCGPSTDVAEAPRPARWQRSGGGMPPTAQHPVSATGPAVFFIL